MSFDIASLSHSDRIRYSAQDRAARNVWRGLTSSFNLVNLDVIVAATRWYALQEKCATCKDAFDEFGNLMTMVRVIGYDASAEYLKDYSTFTVFVFDQSSKENETSFRVPPVKEFDPTDFDGRAQYITDMHDIRRELMKEDGLYGPNNGDRSAATYWFSLYNNSDENIRSLFFDFVEKYDLVVPASTAFKKTGHEKNLSNIAKQLRNFWEISK